MLNEAKRCDRIMLSQAKHLRLDSAQGTGSSAPTDVCHCCVSSGFRIARTSALLFLVASVLSIASTRVSARETTAPPVKILLTFDDGPANPTIFGSPTEHVLDVLKEEKISAAFFVLTTPDRYVFRRISKANTHAGFAILKRELAEGHVVGIHAGGRYGSQWRLHPLRLLRTPYDIDGDNLADFVSAPGNALESDLLQAQARIEAAAQEVGIEAPVRYVRPPFMQYKLGSLDARPTYEALGLKLVLADGNFRDAGYAIHPLSNSIPLLLAIDSALRRGETNIVLALHDSNHWTALKLRRVIHSIRRYFARRSMLEGRDWSFPKERGEVEAVLKSREGP